MAWYPQLHTLTGTSSQLSVPSGTFRGLTVMVLTGSVSVQVGAQAPVVFPAGATIDLHGDSPGDYLVQTVVVAGQSADTTARVVVSIGL